LFVQPEGYVSVCLGQKEGLTAEPQAQIYELWSSQPEQQKLLLQQAEQCARANGSQFLVCQLPPGHRLEAELAEAGFSVDIERIHKEITGLRQPGSVLNLRLARPNDRLFILGLIRRTCANTRPAGREISAPRMLEIFFQSYQSLDFAGDPELITLIAETPGRARAIAYLVIRLGLSEDPDPATFAYIYDIAVHPDHWGKRAPHDLLFRAEQLLKERAIERLVADISASNRRAFLTATKSLGYRLASRRWAKNLTS
jgi:GNAT superfamily N-acetyltransferase